MNFELFVPLILLCSRDQILDPEGSFIQKWNKRFLVSCVLAIFLDALFFYAPVVNRHSNCLDLDNRLQIIVCVLRTINDIFYILHIVFQFRTGFLAPSAREFEVVRLIQNASVIAKRYLPFFIVDILSVFPLPQVVVFIVNPKLQSSVSFIRKDLLKSAILAQFVPRLVRIYLLFKEVTKTSGMFIETAWAGAVINLFAYMLASHVVGAYWYLFSVERQDQCWQDSCRVHNVSTAYLYCGGSRAQDDSAVQYAFLNAFCPLNAPDRTENSTLFDFGIFIKALQSRVVETRDFPYKLSYCLWWGLRNLSSLGSNLETGPYFGEILFAVFISIFGLVLFSLLIGNMQKYLQNLQSIAARVEEEREKRKNSELWMSHRALPEDLRWRIRRYRRYKWEKTRGLEENKLIEDLPKDLRRDIKLHFRLRLLLMVPLFGKLDKQLLSAMCDLLKPVLYTEDSFIIGEGEPIDEMVFFVRGKLQTTATGRITVLYGAGDFSGEELILWALQPQSYSFLPISTRTIRTITEVEAYALMADDLKCLVSSHFWHPLRRKQFVDNGRFYSQQWRTWGACFIQAAWQRYRKRKEAKALRETEERLQDALSKDVESSLSPNGTVFASRFAANLLRALRHKNRLPERPPPFFPQKPAYLDFTR